MPRVIFEILHAERLESDLPTRVPSGLIHDWTGAIFIPGVTLSDVLHVVRDCEQYKEIYHPSVVASKLTGIGEWQDRFSLLLMNESLFAKVALDTDYRSSYTRVDDQRWYSVSETTQSRRLRNSAVHLSGFCPRVTAPA